MEFSSYPIKSGIRSYGAAISQSNSLSFNKRKLNPKKTELLPGRGKAALAVRDSKLGFQDQSAVYKEIVRATFFAYKAFILSYSIFSKYMPI